MNIGLKTALTTIVTFLALSAAATAATIVAPTNALQVLSGEDISLSLTGLPGSDGTGGTLSVYARGDYEDSNPAKRPGESLSVDVEGTILSSQLGSFDPNDLGVGVGGPFDFFNQIRPNLEVEFQRTFTLSGAFLDALLADGTVNVLLNLGDDVNVINADSRVNIVLKYQEAIELSPVPLPAGMPLLLVGLTGLGLLARRKAG